MRAAQSSETAAPAKLNWYLSRSADANCPRLAQVYRGTRSVGVTEHDAWRTLLKVALDGVPIIRGRSIRELIRAGADGG